MRQQVAVSSNGKASCLLSPSFFVLLSLHIPGSGEGWIYKLLVYFDFICKISNKVGSPGGDCHVQPQERDFSTSQPCTHSSIQPYFYFRFFSSSFHFLFPPSFPASSSFSSRA